MRSRHFLPGKRASEPQYLQWATPRIVRPKGPPIDFATELELSEDARW